MKLQKIKKIIGIDPGLTGAISSINIENDQTFIKISDIPTQYVSFKSYQYHPKARVVLKTKTHLSTEFEEKKENVVQKLNSENVLKTENIYKSNTYNNNSWGDYINNHTYWPNLNNLYSVGKTIAHPPQAYMQSVSIESNENKNTSSITERTKNTLSLKGSKTSDSNSFSKKRGGISPAARVGVKALLLGDKKEPVSVSISGVYSLLLKEIQEEPNSLVIIENQYSRPVQSSASAFSLGYTFGVLISALSRLDVPYLVENPNLWKRRLNLTGENKDKSIEMALQLYPQAASRIYQKKHHNRAESLLLAHYGYRLLYAPF